VDQRAGWISERALRRESDDLLGPGVRGRRRHLADGAIEAPETVSTWDAGPGDELPRVAIEVDLTLKAARRTPEIVRELGYRYQRVIWFAAPDVLDPLRARLGQLQPSNNMVVEVRPLPEISGLSYGVLS
jgi:hypothetical protein